MILYTGGVLLKDVERHLEAARNEFQYFLEVDMTKEDWKEYIEWSRNLLPKKLIGSDYVPQYIRYCFIRKNFSSDTDKSGFICLAEYEHMSEYIEKFGACIINPDPFRSVLF